MIWGPHRWMKSFATASAHRSIQTTCKSWTNRPRAIWKSWTSLRTSERRSTSMTWSCWRIYSRYPSYSQSCPRPSFPRATSSTGFWNKLRTMRIHYWRESRKGAQKPQLSYLSMAPLLLSPSAYCQLLASRRSSSISHNQGRKCARWRSMASISRRKRSRRSFISLS